MTLCVCVLSKGVSECVCVCVCARVCVCVGGWVLKGVSIGYSKAIEDFPCFWMG